MEARVHLEIVEKLDYLDHKDPKVNAANQDLRVHQAVPGSQVRVVHQEFQVQLENQAHQVFLVREVKPVCQAQMEHQVPGVNLVCPVLRDQ